jgi:universal stress protein A
MYRRILVALENAKSDTSVLPHISQLAALVGAEILLLHVADGWAARNFTQLNLAESDEMRVDRAYLEDIAVQLRAKGLVVETQLALGNPPQEILRAAEQRSCDLIAMTSHGHKLFADLLLGSTIDKVRHNTTIPILVVRAKSKSGG